MVLRAVRAMSTPTNDKEAANLRAVLAMMAVDVDECSACGASTEEQYGEDVPRVLTAGECVEVSPGVFHVPVRCTRCGADHTIRLEERCEL